MSDAIIFAFGCFVATVCAGAVGIMIWAAYTDRDRPLNLDRKDLSRAPSPQGKNSEPQARMNSWLKHCRSRT